mmetsp:Transcript_32693/g.70119  ORF Transcript_32693/g.70119 Transcript_32693/m.70119 type:complete len:292 (+) Transcript_32693:674-1549(+)
MGLDFSVGEGTLVRASLLGSMPLIESPREAIDLHRLELAQGLPSVLLHIIKALPSDLVHDVLTTLLSADDISDLLAVLPVLGRQFLSLLLLFLVGRVYQPSLQHLVVAISEADLKVLDRSALEEFLKVKSVLLGDVGQPQVWISDDLSDRSIRQLGCSILATHHRQQSRLACTIGADHSHTGVLSELQGQVVQNCLAIVGVLEGNVLGFKDRFRLLEDARVGERESDLLLVAPDRPSSGVHGGFPSARLRLQHGRGAIVVEGGLLDEAAEVAIIVLELLLVEVDDVGADCI